MSSTTNPTSVPAFLALPPIGGQQSQSGSMHPAHMSQSMHTIKASKIMIIDDEPLVVRVVRRFLHSAGYTRFVEVNDSLQAIDLIQKERPDLVLLDIMMPSISGLDLLRARHNVPACKYTPFIILSASSDTQTKRECLQLGATEFLNKPVDPSDLVLRVQNALLVKAHQDHLANYAVELERKVRERTAELEQSREQIIHCLAKAAEYRDNDTGYHVIRVGKYAAVIAHQLGFNETYCRQIELAAQLHDVGKIGVPDAILLNPGKLDAEEFEVMKQHCDLGCQIIQPLAARDVRTVHRHATMGADILASDESPLMALAANIARTHHEKWDGTGYPLGLRGEQIPIEGRITCVADVFDALSSRRPYKEPFPLARCLTMMREESGIRFDPKVLDAFFARIADIDGIRIKFSDE